MKTSNPTQLKAFIKKQAVEKKVSAQLIMQNYMLERLLARISESKYKRNFILKGGFLISAIVGLDTRTTMDLDTTITGLDLTHESVLDIFHEICAIDLDDDITFTVDRSEDIRETDDYPGIRVYLFRNYNPIKVPLTVDITTGDKITPREIEYTFQCMFDDTVIDVMAYNLETVLAEKLETVLSRGIVNTRPRDFYDLYILYKIRTDEIDIATLRLALEKTSSKRSSLWIFENKEAILKDINKSTDLLNRWNAYCRKYEYAKDITYTDVIDSLIMLLDTVI